MGNPKRQEEEEGEKTREEGNAHSQCGHEHWGSLCSSHPFWRHLDIPGAPKRRWKGGKWEQPGSRGRPALEQMCYGIKEEDKDMQQGFTTPLSRALGTPDQLFNLSTPCAP